MTNGIRIARVLLLVVFGILAVVGFDADPSGSAATQEDTIETVAGSNWIYGVDIAISADGLPMGVARLNGFETLAGFRCDTTDCVGTDATPLGGRSAAAAVDSLGNLVVVTTEGNGDLAVHRCASNDCADGNPVVVSLDRPYGLGLVLDRYDRPVLTLSTRGSGDAGEAPGSVDVLHCTTIDCSGPQSVNRVAEAWNLGETRLNRRGHPVLLARTGANTISVLQCSDPACAGEVSSELIDFSGRDLSFYNDWVDLELDRKDRPVVAFQRINTDGVVVVRCDTQSCAGRQRLAVVDTGTSNPRWSAATGRYVSMKLDRYDRPVLAYAGRSGWLRVAFCSTRTCSGAVEEVRVPGRLFVDNDLDLVLDQEDNPVIGVTTRGTHNGVADVVTLAIVRCGDPNGCAGSDRDVDGVHDGSDNCPRRANQNQSDRNENGVGDACDNFEIPKPCRGFEAANVIVGTRGSDTLRGTPGRDVIVGLAGDDILIGGDGNDCVLGGSGDDVLRGGSGSDRLWGRTGDDAIDGNAGRDRAFGGQGSDECKRVTRQRNC